MDTYGSPIKNMIISDKKRFIFIHNPKTAGESVELALRPYASLVVSAPEDLHNRLNKHSSPAAIRKYVGKKRWNTYFKFVFVRNPWDRLVSLYMYARGRKEGKLAKRLSFDKFLAHYSKRHKRFIMQKNYFIDARRKRVVDFIGKFEDIENSFLVICKKINVTCKLPYKNKSVHDNYKEYYTRKTIKLVAALSRDEIKLFNYVF